MRNQLFFAIAILTAISIFSCKKDKENNGEEDTTCTETRPMWLNGSAGDFTFVTSEPCGNLRLANISVSQTRQEFGGHLFTFTSSQEIHDTLGRSMGTIRVSIAARVLGEQVDTVYNGNDTLYTVTAPNICNNMNLGKHYAYASEASQNNANAFVLEYTDTLGSTWQGFMPTTDSSFVVTSVDGIISQNLFPGAYYPYCVVSFAYDALLLNQAAMDTIRLKGTGRLGFR